MMWHTEIIIALIFAGASAGFMAGLLGLGGGTIIVPIMLWLLHKQGVGGAYVQHMALASSFAIMIFTTISSAWSQHKRGAINWRVAKILSPAMILGSFIGSTMTQYLSKHFLQIFFVVFLYTIALQMMLKLKPKPSRQLPSNKGLFGVGNAIGLVSSWVGVGGGALSVPFMTYCNVPIHVATGTSAVLAWAISAAGVLGYISSGWNVSGLPEHTLGFVYLPAVAILAVCTVTFAPLGVKVAHQLPAPKLKMAMGLFLFFIASQMLWTIVFK